ncbi:glycosyltransferase [uncultured Clostridium sp.]|uniref:glycosyltransferase n=1 Tax=uncultured Clostridium sp. TaxID=59620 RepID=UPI002593C595|nr:glycosyltransferase [uncultured Clostridium sp.]
MIFVTVGTHEQPFNRLIEYIDKLRGNQIIKEDIIIQIGFSTYEPKYCKWSKLYSYEQMNQYVKEARIVITHGGPSSFIMPLQLGKIPIVVPRQSKYNEHVNNHQLDFANAVEKRQGNIIVVEKITDLSENIFKYDEIVASKQVGYKSNNYKFNIEFEKLVKELFEGK